MTRGRLALVPLLFTLALPVPAEADPESADRESSLAEEPGPGPFQMVSTAGGVSLHEDNYVLPLTWSEDYKGRETEIVFQLSAKLRILGSRVFIGFTQISFWQAYNADASSPFRDTNYNPEVFYRLAPDNGGYPRWGFDFGYEHQSNGRSRPLSRSWDRLYVAAYHPTERSLYYLKAWYRIPEDECPIDENGRREEWCRDDPSTDDNPDITDFLGHVEFHYRRRLSAAAKPQQLHLMARGNLSTGKGAISLDFTHPAKTKNLHWFALLYHGYGESMLDYDRSITRIGAGILLRQ
jgi:phospholipase A1